MSVKRYQTLHTCGCIGYKLEVLLCINSLYLSLYSPKELNQNIKFLLKFLIK